MFSKIVTLAALVAVAYAQADRYPAGVDPRSCPNYPICDNSIAPTQYNAPPQYNPAPYNAPPPTPNYYNAPAAPAPAAGYPAGVSPLTCPNYPYCTNAATQYNAPPLPGFDRRLYPDGVNPAACPNYPYCN